MAIGVPVDCGGTFTASSATPTNAVSPAIAAGQFVMVFIGWTNTAVLNSVSDAKGNSYAIIAQANSASSNFAIASGQCATALAFGDLVQANFGSAAANIWVTVVKCGGIATSTPLDQKSATDNGNSNAWDSGLTSATTQADELVIGGSFDNASTDAASPSTADPGLTTLQNYDSTGNGFCITVAYKIVSATGTYKASGSWGVTTGDATTSAVATYKAAAAVSAAFANVRAFQEDGDPRVFQPQAFQRPDPIVAFQEFRLEPEGFQANAFQRPDWIQAFQDSLFADETFQEGPDAFADLVMQGNAFQQDLDYADGWIHLPPPLRVFVSREAQRRSSRW